MRKLAMLKLRIRINLMIEMILLFLFYSCKKFGLIFKPYSICDSGDQSILVLLSIKLSQAPIFSLIFEIGFFDLGSTYPVDEFVSVTSDLTIFWSDLVLS